MVWRFFVPAASTEEGALEVRIPRYEGFWRSSSHADENLPWPQPQPKWPQSASFLEVLDRAEADAESVSYRGFSHYAAFADAETAVKVFDWMSGSGLRASDTMWPTTKFARPLNLNSSFENGHNEQHG